MSFKDLPEPSKISEFEIHHYAGKGCAIVFPNDYAIVGQFGLESALRMILAYLEKKQEDFDSKFISPGNIRFTLKKF